MSSPADQLTPIRVNGDSPYDVLVGVHLADRVPLLVEGSATVAVLRPDALAALAEPVVSALAAASKQVVEITLPDGEQAKSLATAQHLWDELATSGIDRNDAVVAVGGGATTDVAGFVAATWLRGVRVVHVPTTLLGMVDAAVGGKTAVNTKAGKNLVGAFHPPAGVVVDLATVATLPAAEWVNGMAEVIKAGFIADPAILDLIESDLAGAQRPTGPHTRELVERSIAVKAAVVSADLREAGPRESLNYGHTLGHAIERVEDYGMPHGHAVSIGLVFAAALSQRTTGLDAGTGARHRQILEGIGLPTRYRGDAWPQLHAAMRHDKKSRAGKLRFIVLAALAEPVVAEAPDDGLLEQAFAEVAG
jgi:3-dehydroquinate synthase